MSSTSHLPFFTFPSAASRPFDHLQSISLWNGIPGHAPTAMVQFLVCPLKLTQTVVVRFKSIGAAPIMKTNVFKVTAGNKFQAVITFLRGQLGLKAGDPMVS